MKKKTIFVAVIVVLVGVFLYSALQSTKPVEIPNAPDWRTLEQAQEEARVTGKLILVDVYEDGCKYCRALEREVYPIQPYERC